MINKNHPRLIMRGSKVWNTWREQHPEVQPDLRFASLMGANLEFANLSRANLSRANLSSANLSRANLSSANLMGADLSDVNLMEANLEFAYLTEANLSRADLSRADLSRANLYRASLSRANLSDADLSNIDLSSTDLFEVILVRAKLMGANLMEAGLTEVKLMGANLMGANLMGAYLSRADLSNANFSNADLSNSRLKSTNLSNANLMEADLSRADLSRATLVGTNLTKTKLKDCRIYGITAWDIRLDGAEQLNLTITPQDQPTITVDNLKIAQFIYLLLNNAEIRDVIDTIARKVVLILGRFSTERKAVLDALRDELRKQNYSPVLFDFEKPSSRNFTETVSTLAHLSRFIIADLTNPSSVPQELYAIIPTLAVPVQPLLEASNREYSMFSDFKRYPWVLPIYRYADLPDLLQSVHEKVIKPAEQKAKQLEEQS